MLQIYCTHSVNFILPKQSSLLEVMCYVLNVSVKSQLKLIHTGVTTITLVKNIFPKFEPYTLQTIIPA